MGNNNALTYKDQQKALQDPKIAATANQIKHLIVNGRKLSNDEAIALAIFSVKENLDAQAQECWYIPGSGPMPGIKGLRRKAQEQLALEEPGTYNYFHVDYFDITEQYRREHDDPNIGYAFRAVLKDSHTGIKYLEAKTKFKREGLTTEEIVDALGNPPSWEYIGTWSKLEKNVNKDKLYPPIQRAQKRAEAGAIRLRFNLNYMIPEDIGGAGFDSMQISQDSFDEIGAGTGEESGGQQQGEPPYIDPQFDANYKNPEQVRLEILGNVEDIRALGDKGPVSRDNKGAVLSCLQSITEPGDTNMHRHIILKYIFGVSSSKDLDDAQWRGLGKYLEMSKLTTGEWVTLNPVVQQEIRNLLAVACMGEGQEELNSEAK